MEVTMTGFGGFECSYCGESIGRYDEVTIKQVPNGIVILHAECKDNHD